VGFLFSLWPFAPSPTAFSQLYENIRRQSSDGLSLIFLLNWYLGDFSNLMGCILTHQLPFQTWLATYFVFVDTMLVFQYFYYARKPSDLHHERVISVPQPVIHTERTPSRYRTISAVAANVAAAAALAAQHDELGHARRHTHRQRRYTGQSFDLMHGEAQVEEEELPSREMDSFYSEDGHATRRSPERYRGRGGSLGRHSLIATHGTSSTLYLNTVEPNSKGDLTLVEREQTDEMTEVPSGPSTGRRRNSRAGRGGAGLVFLGVWALFSLGGHSTGGEYLRLNPNSSKGVVGRVLGASTTNVTPTVHIKHQDPQLQQHESEIDVIFSDEWESTQFHLTATSDAEILGRIFAWLCTTLYLTCRLPQIWKNYARKSVEGLSMSLFICAFLGNFFYVASIVSSPRFNLPPPLSTEYIRESIPYILGSGGTLMFDVGILSQFFAYRRRHRCSFSDDSPVSEETGLLIGTQTHYHVAEHSSRGRTSNVKVTE